MTAEEFFQVEPLAAYQWPVTWRFTITGPWGETRQELTVDVPSLTDNIEASQKLGEELWRRSIATAMCRQMALSIVETMCWRGSLAPLPAPAILATGLLDGTPTGRSDAAVVVQHSGHMDDLARRRFFLPGIPETWVHGRKLILGARDALQWWGEALGIGIARHRFGGDMQWLLAYPELLPPTIDNVRGVAFRKVVRLRGMEYTERAPELSSVPWP